MPKKFALPTLLIVLLFTAWQVYNLRSLRFDYEFENFLPIGDRELAYYQYFKDNFESDNDYLLLGLTADESVLDSAFIAHTARLTSLLSGLPQVQSVVSPTEAGEYRMLPDGNVITLPWLRRGDVSDSLRIVKNRVQNRFLIDDSLQRVSLVVKLLPPSGKKASDDALLAIYSAIEEAGLDQNSVVIAGKARAQNHYIALMQKEMPYLLGISILVVILLLYMLYRSVWWMLLPLATVLLTVIGTLGSMAFLGIPIDILMVALPSILFVVATSDVIHLLTRYLEELRREQPHAVALKLAFKEVGLATFLTSLTTAVGFLTLLTASIRPIRSFGLVAGLGVFLAFIITFTFLPSLLAILPRPSIYKAVRAGEIWQKRLKAVLDMALGHRRLIIGVSFIVFLVSLAGTFMVRTDSYLISDLPDDDVLRQDFQYIDRYFGGSRTIEITYTLTDSLRAYDLPVLQAMETFERQLEEGPIEVMASPLTVAYITQQTITGGDTAAYRLPQTTRETRQFRRHIGRASQQAAETLQADSGHVFRVSARIPDIGSRATLAEINRLQGLVDTSGYRALLQPRFTGTSLLIDRNNETLAKNMLTGLLLAAILVAIIAALLYRSTRMALIALIPNLLPLLITSAIMGFLGISLRLSTSVIFTIAFGIAVDDTLHFLSKLRLMEKRGYQRTEALYNTFRLTGKAIVVTTLLLTAGFMTFLFSHFGAIYYMGLLVSVTLVSALVVDLLLLPVILSYFGKKPHT